MSREHARRPSSAHGSPASAVAVSHATPAWTEHRRGPLHVLATAWRPRAHTSIDPPSAEHAKPPSAAHGSPTPATLSSHSGPPGPWTHPRGPRHRRTRSSLDPQRETTARRSAWQAGGWGVHGAAGAPTAAGGGGGGAAAGGDAGGADSAHDHTRTERRAARRGIPRDYATRPGAVTWGAR